MGASSDAGGLVVPRNASSSASKTPQRANGSGSPIIAAVPSASSSPATTRFSCSRPGPRRRRRSTSAAASRSHLRRRLSMPSGHIPDQADHAPNAARTSHEGTPSQAERSSPHLEPRPHQPRRGAPRASNTALHAPKGRAPCVEYSSSRPEGAPSGPNAAHQPRTSPASAPKGRLKIARGAAPGIRSQCERGALKGRPISPTHIVRRTTRRTRAGGRGIPPGSSARGDAPSVPRCKRAPGPRLIG